MPAGFDGRVGYYIDHWILGPYGDEHASVLSTATLTDWNKVLPRREMKKGFSA